MKNLKIFASIEEYEAAKPSMDTPFVVLAGNELVYSNLVEITEDDITDGDVVDLGLPSGLKWASCNIGADKPCDYGLLFQFGCVDGYAYNDTNHKFQPGGWDAPIPTTASGKTYAAGDVLQPADDAAYVATDGKLRMPTVGEIDELLTGTTNTWCQCTVLGDDHKEHTVYGRLFISKTDETKKIFIPAAGCFNDSFFDGGSYGRVWSSSVSSSGVYNACYLGFYSGLCTRGLYDRCFGFSVRGVCE